MKLQLFVLMWLVFALISFPGFVNPVHGARVGLVCLADVSSAPLPPAAPCPAAPGPVFNAPSTSPAQQIRIGVFVSGSDALDGFDITLLAGHAVLRPAGIDLSGSVLLQPAFVLFECVGGVNLTVAPCAPNDSVDTLRVAAAGSFGGITSSPVTGLLFTAIYNVTGRVLTGGISVGFQTGCMGTSVSGGVCVTIANGTVVPVPETVQAASFSNASLVPFLSISAGLVSVGPSNSGLAGSFKLDLTAQNGWPGLNPCPCLAGLSTRQSTGLNVSLSSMSVDMSLGGSAVVDVNVSSSRKGDFFVTMYAQYSTVDSANFYADTLVAPLTVEVVVDFTLQASPVRVVAVLAGSTGSSLIMVRSLNGFSGRVSLSVTPASDPCSFSTASVLLGGLSNSTLTCTYPSAGNYMVRVMGVAGYLAQSVTLGFSVQDFTVNPDSGSVTVKAGSSVTVTIRVAGLNGFDGLVRVQVASSTGLRVSVSESGLTGSGSFSLALTGVAVGDYKVIVTCTSGTLSHSVQVMVAVAPLSSGPITIWGLEPPVFYSLLGFFAVLAGALLFGFRSHGKVHARHGSGAGP